MGRFDGRKRTRRVPRPAVVVVDPVAPASYGAEAMHRQLSLVLTKGIELQVRELSRSCYALDALIGTDGTRAVFDRVLQQLREQNGATSAPKARTDVQSKRPGNGVRKGPQKTKRRGLSPEGRARIIAAQRKRWGTQKARLAKKAARPK